MQCVWLTIKLGCLYIHLKEKRALTCLCPYLRQLHHEGISLKWKFSSLIGFLAGSLHKVFNFFSQFCNNLCSSYVIRIIFPLYKRKRRKSSFFSGLNGPKWFPWSWMVLALQMAWPLCTGPVANTVMLLCRAEKPELTWAWQPWAPSSISPSAAPHQCSLPWAGSYYL